MLNLIIKKEKIYFIMGKSDALNLLNIFDSQNGVFVLEGGGVEEMTFSLSDDEYVKFEKNRINFSLTEEGFDYGKHLLNFFLNNGYFFPAEFYEFERSGEGEKDRLIKTFFFSDDPNSIQALKNDMNKR